MKIIHVIGSYDPAKGGPQAVVVGWPQRRLRSVTG